jgi:2-polyprenyl-3-methyl-5-hydroxy-6-metoxy-1,4-benzoquinol methylase
MFRWPKETSDWNVSFYRNRYREGLVTELPDRREPRAAMELLPDEAARWFAPKLAVLRALVPAGRVLDYGSSWGYCTLQLKATGYDAVGFEISKPRANFGNARLGLNILHDPDALERYAGYFDVILASHVLEHLPSLFGVFDRFRLLLKPTGALLVFVPNCEGRNARKLGARWGPMCCEKHPLAFEASFFEGILPQHGFPSVGTFSDPYDPPVIARLLAASRRASGDLSGDELMVWAQKMSPTESA